MSGKLCVVCGVRPATIGQVPCCTECQRTWKEVEGLIHKEWKKDEIRCPKLGGDRRVDPIQPFLIRITISDKYLPLHGHVIGAPE